MSWFPGVKSAFGGRGTEGDVLSQFRSSSSSSASRWCYRHGLRADISYRMETRKSPRRVLIVTRELARRFLLDCSRKLSHKNLTLPQLFGCRTRENIRTRAIGALNGPRGQTYTFHRISGAPPHSPPISPRPLFCFHTESNNTRNTPLITSEIQAKVLP